MNIVRSFAAYLEGTQDGVTYEKNLFISRAPASNTVDKDGDVIPQNIWWLKSGGAAGREGLLYINPIEVYYRDRNSEALYDKMQSLGDTLSCAGCLSLENFDVVRADVTGLFTDQDLDDEERTVGLLTVNVITYKKGC